MSLQRSLAQSYDVFHGMKAKKKAAVSSSALATVLEKLEEAASKGRKKSAVKCQQEDVDTATGQPVSSTPEGQEGAPEASALEASEAEKRERAKSLIDEELLWVHFFSGVLDDVSDAVEETADEGKIKYSHFQEREKASERAEHRSAGVCSFPMKLILVPLKTHCRVANVFASLLEEQFGPLHVALQVGGVILEWGTSSLVEPHLCADEDRLMEVDMQHHSEWMEYTGKHCSTIKRAAKDLDFSEQIEWYYGVSSEKRRLIGELIKVIIRYNTHFYYNVFDRNCHHFISDALDALQVSMPKKIPGDLGNYFGSLVRGRTPSVPSEFKTHAVLDKYVREGAISDMPQHDLEFLLALYFRFHVESRSRLKDHKALEQWQCQEKDCCMEKIEKLIEMESMKIHDFITVTLK